MQEENEEHQQKPRKTLNFNASLLSTRRPANLGEMDLSSCPSVRRHSAEERIPFSWERAPGKPKEESETLRHEEEEEEDMFSLSEAIDIAERSEKKRSSGGDALRMKIMEDRSRDRGHIPDFIIQRFLPDAEALAEASLRKSNTWEAPVPFSSKGCGLDTVLFPWRGKHRLCGARGLPFHPSSSTSKHKRW